MSQVRYVDRAELARLLSIGERTITGYVADYPDFPSRLRAGRRKFPVGKCVRWYVDFRLAVAEARERGRKGRHEGPDNPAYRKALANAELAEIEVAVQLRTLVPEEEFVEAVTDMCQNLRAALRAVPTRHAARMLHITTEEEAIRRLGVVEDELLAAIRRPHQAPDGGLAA